MKRSIIAILASLVLAFGICPAFALAAPAANADATMQGVAKTEQLSASSSVGSESSDLSAQSLQAPRAQFAGVTATKGYVKSKYNASTDEYTAKAGGVSLRAYRASSYGYDYQCVLEATYNGTTKTIGRTIAGGFVTNGRYVFFSMGVTPVDAGPTYNGHTSHYYTYKAIVYRYDLKTGKAKKVAAGTDMKVFATDGTYLYCGPQSTSVTNGKLIVKKVGASKKGTLLPCSPNQIAIAKGRAVFTSFRMQVCDSRLYTSKVGSKGKKLIESHADGFRVSGKKIVYMKGEYVNGILRCRVYQCSLTGKNKQALSDWTEDFNALRTQYRLN